MEYKCHHRVEGTVKSEQGSRHECCRGEGPEGKPDSAQLCPRRVTGHS